MQDLDENTENAKCKKALAQRRKAAFAENWCWVAAGLVLILILQTHWKPGSDWTVAIKWIVLMSPIYYVIWSLIKIVRLYMLDDDEHRY